jgi:glutamate-1-semialdehyde 2,1-aminomutase
MVLPDPGFHAALRELTHHYGTLLLIDETHTLSAGPQGYTGAFGLVPDAMVIGKAIAGGVPCAVYGVTEALAGRMHQAWREAGPGRTGIGTTLSGSLLQIAALHATLGSLITEAHYARMFERTAHYAARVREVLDRHALDWTVTTLGARSELQYTDRAPRTAREAASGFDAGLEALIQLYLLNRGVVLTPFHNMALMSPATSLDDVEALVDGLDACLTELGEIPR